MSLPRVLFLIQRYRPTFSGAALQVEILGEALRRRGIETAVVTQKIREAPGHEPDATPPVYRFDMPATRNPAALWWGSRKLRRFLTEQRDRFDILHIQGAPPVLPLILPHAHRLGWKTAITSTLLFSDDPATVATGGRMGWWRIRAYQRADGFMAVSRALVDRFPAAGIPADRVSQIPPGIDTEQFRPTGDRDALAAELGWEPGVPRAFFVGAVMHRKGIDILLDAWERVAREHPTAVLYIAGPTEFGSGQVADLDKFAAAAMERAASGPLSGRVRFLGPVDDPATLARMYAAAHMFVFPTRMEGFGIVIAEALAAGTPVIVARIPGITDDNVRDGVTGIVVPQEDPAALAEAVDSLLSSPERHAALAAAAREDAVQRFSLDAVTGSFVDFYQRLFD